MKAELEHHPPREELAAFIGSVPHATFFHSPPWLESLEAAFGSFGSEWLTVRERGELLGAMPVVRVARGPLFSLWSLPFGTYGGPVARDASIETLLLTRFFELARSPLCVEGGVTLFHPAPDGAIPGGVSLRPEECMIAPLEAGFDALWRTGWSSKRRQLVRRAEEAGVAVRLLENEEEVRRFHELYARESRGWGGVHPYPRALFLELFRRRQNGALMWGAFFRSQMLGGHIDLYFGELAQAWQGGMAEEAKEFEVGALLIKKAMEEACARGCRAFNLGSSGGSRGILFFKESLGGRPLAYTSATARKCWWGLLRGRRRD